VIDVLGDPDALLVSQSTTTRVRFFVPRTAVGKLDVLCFDLMPFKDNI
jgi:hypothetical protein